MRRRVNTLLNCWSWKVFLIYSNSWPSGFSETDEKTFDFLRKLSSRQSVSLPIAYLNYVALNTLILRGSNYQRHVCNTLC